VATASHPQVILEVAMGRKFIDCREIPSEVKCSLTIAADSVDEVLNAAVLHAVAVHKETDTPRLREEIRSMIKEGPPPA
jgi:predicted small metal-binding protein